ncbi:molybdenum cofactor guanylyltransferase MobA [Pseudomonas sp.]|uniref:molybdenum cofactor guanylyltransferase MobA n=1 Tax=Pseudomonas sp. TaxID=306 RepID=UPI0019FB4456|nr:molybdenum cofactor guanylyltransferase MobA [Pseudomonas sp.]MBF0674566.1 molybdenum cofactor guanylyltransferase MobA [Pseudomonas sp.]MBF0675942.1 molybdenum cofactor guanylyltransferase MobA [Pseudomonas sp.]
MPAPLALPSCSVLLLAGGRGQRMGGRDKGLIDWQGRPLIAWLHDCVRPLTDDLIISCNRNIDRYRHFADRLVTDQNDDFPGPLAGIRAGLAAARHDHLLILPCDAPLIDGDLIDAIRQQAVRHPQRPVMLRQGDHWQPLFSLIPVSLRDSIEHAWLAGERAPRHVFIRHGAIALDCPEDDIRLANLNTPHLLQHAVPAGNPGGT